MTWIPSSTTHAVTFLYFFAGFIAGIVLARASDNGSDDDDAEGGES